MTELPIERAFTLIEPGPVLLVTTFDGVRPNVMTISWVMVADFTPTFVMMTGPWNYSFAALMKSKECVLNVPSASLVKKVVGVGTVSGGDVDKFQRFRLTPRPALEVKAPLIAECIGAVECRVSDYVKKHGLIILSGVRAHVNPDRRDQRMLHAVGDGTFRADGASYDYREAMREKLPPGL